MTTTLGPVNYWPQSATVKAFWGQQELPPYKQLLNATIAWAEPEVLARLGEPLAQLTPQTLSTREALERELARVRNRGYAVDNQEQEPGVGCVAAAIFRGDDVVVAAISVSAPMTRIRAADPVELGELLRARAAAVSEELFGA